MFLATCRGSLLAAFGRDLSEVPIGQRNSSSYTVCRHSGISVIEAAHQLPCEGRSYRWGPASVFCQHVQLDPLLFVSAAAMNDPSFPH